MSGVSFRDMVEADNRAVFLCPDEFADRRTIRYDGKEYPNIPVVLTGVKEQARSQMDDDHAAGLYLASTVLHCALDDLGGVQPEKGQRIYISQPKESSADTEEDGEETAKADFFLSFYIAESNCEMGMIHAKLEEIDE